MQINNQILHYSEREQHLDTHSQKCQCDPDNGTENQQYYLCADSIAKLGCATVMATASNSVHNVTIRLFIKLHSRQHTDMSMPSKKL
jgi:hypothetical protein